MKNVRIAVIGGGASGCMAAIAAARQGAEVTLIERNDRIGRKLSATGNGKCNLTNLRTDSNCWYSGGNTDLSAFFDIFGPQELIAFFKGLGVYVHDRNGYVYPRTDQAATIVRALEKELQKTGVQVVRDCRVLQLTKENTSGFFKIRGEYGKTILADRVIVCCGGLAGPSYGCSGDGFDIAGTFGHTATPLRPALTGLQCPDKRLKRAAGARCDAALTLRSGVSRLRCERGELQINAQGLSGIVVFQLSHEAGALLRNRKEAVIEVDFLPEISKEEWETEIDRRLSLSENVTLGDFFLGLVNERVLAYLLDKCSLQAETKRAKIADAGLREVFGLMKHCEFEITGTAGYEQAQVTAGGIPLSETDENLQSNKTEGLYFAGELLDVDGICGGYNLQWAFTSGYIAGTSAGQ